MALLYSIERVFDMARRKDTRGIGEIPTTLYIVIIMGVLVVVAILAMLSTYDVKGTLHIEIDGTTGHINCTAENATILKVNATGTEKVHNISFVTFITVSDAEGNPVTNATVVVSGAQSTSSNVTNETGRTRIQIDDAILGEEQTSVRMALTVTASGFYTYEEADAFLLQRILAL